MFADRFQVIAGRKIYRHPDVIEVGRSWRERLFTRPWRPWIKNKWIPNPLFKGRDECLCYGDTFHVTDSQYYHLEEYWRTHDDIKRSP